MLRHRDFEIDVYTRYVKALQGSPCLDGVRTIKCMQINAAEVVSQT